MVPSSTWHHIFGERIEVLVYPTGDVDELPDEHRPRAALSDCGRLCTVVLGRGPLNSDTLATIVAPAMEAAAARGR